MTTQHVDVYGHVSTPPGENALAVGLISTSAAGTIVPTTSAGASATTSAVDASDNAGNYTLNAVTGGGAQAAGETSHVYFAQSFRKAPKAVIVQCMDITTASTPVNVPAYATSITSAGFAVTTPALTTAHAYQIVYHVIL